MGAAGAGAALGAGGDIFAGIQANKAAIEEAKEAALTTTRRAERAGEELESFKGSQELAFLSSGVLLEGSPLLLLQETEEKGRADIKADIRAGFRGAQSLRRRGRDRLISGIVSGGAKGVQAFK